MPKQWLTNFLIAVVVATLVFLTYEFAHHWWSHNFVVRTIDYVVGNLANRSGVSVFLVRGLVILLTIPFFWAVAKCTYGLFWFRGVGPSLSLYRNPYGLVIVGYAGLFFIAMYFASREAYAYKWCAETLEGIKTFDGPGKDPVYGIEAKPCTFEQIVAIREGEKVVSGPQRIQIADVKQFPFFDPITGKPRVWYYKSPDGSYEFYDRFGKHPGTGDDLRPIDQQTRMELIRLQDLHAAQVEQRQVQAKEQAATQAAAENQRQHQAFLEHYINTSIVKRPGRKQAAVLVLRETQSTINGIEDSLGNALSQHGVEPSTSFFKPSFVLEGRARRLLDGDWDQIRQLELNTRIDYVVLGAAAVSFSPSQQFDGLISANLRVELKCLTVSSQRVCGSQHFEIVGAGFSNGAALENAVGKTRPQIDSFVGSMQLD
ncbi:MAG TPA: hypothetical protein VGT24_10545 [Candidatus Acidoferrales bacterium]|nr:hypothetical protein [Candidatus Acidoferrales bacterium]